MKRDEIKQPISCIVPLGFTFRVWEQVKGWHQPTISVAPANAFSRLLRRFISVRFTYSVKGNGYLDNVTLTKPHSETLEEVIKC